MKPLFDSLVRTYVPWLAGIIIGWLVSLGVDLDPEVAPQITALLMLAASMLYYVLARVFETYISPKLGWMLGLAKSPTYDDEAPATIPEYIVEAIANDETVAKAAESAVADVLARRDVPSGLD